MKKNINEENKLIHEGSYIDEDDFLQIKLIKQDNDGRVYSTIWNEEEKVVIYSGTVGDNGEQNEVKLSSSQKAVFCKKKVHNCARFFAEFCHPI